MVDGNRFDNISFNVVSYLESPIFIVQRFTKLERSLMTPKEIVMGGYQSFADGDMEGLGKIYDRDALIRVNGNHELSGEYRGFDDFLDLALAKKVLTLLGGNIDP